MQKHGSAVIREEETVFTAPNFADAADLFRHYAASATSETMQKIRREVRTVSARFQISPRTVRAVGACRIVKSAQLCGAPTSAWRCEIYVCAPGGSAEAAAD